MYLYHPFIKKNERMPIPLIIISDIGFINEIQCDVAMYTFSVFLSLKDGDFSKTNFSVVEIEFAIVIIFLGLIIVKT